MFCWFRVGEAAGESNFAVGNIHYSVYSEVTLDSHPDSTMPVEIDFVRGSQLQDPRDVHSRNKTLPTLILLLWRQRPAVHIPPQYRLRAAKKVPK